MRGMRVAILIAFSFAGEPTHAAELVRNIHEEPQPNLSDQGAHEFFRLGDRVLFLHGPLDIARSQLWATDGSVAGLTLLADDISPGSVAYGEAGFALFQSRRLLWRTDGTVAGTFPLRTCPQVQEVGRMIAFDDQAGVLYFASWESDSGARLWRTDGTPEGTRRVADLPVWTSGAVVRGGILFGATTAATGFELWWSDGTEAGTNLVADLEPGTRPSGPAEFLSLGDRVLFFADQTAFGREPWVSDGTEQGTHMLADLHPGPGGESGVPRRLGPGKACFLSVRPVERLFCTDGTSPGTLEVTPEGVEFVKFVAEPEGEGVGEGGLLFLGRTAEHGTEIWTTDSTVPGTRLVADLCPGPCSYFNLSWPATAGGAIGLAAGRWLVGLYDGQVYGLAVTDGTAGGTAVLRWFAAQPPLDLSVAKSASGRGYFLNEDDIWTSDGTAAGTRVLLEDAGGRILGIAAAALPDGRVALAAHDETHGSEVWVTDGRPEGTHLLHDVQAPLDGSSRPASLTSLGDRVYFSADDGFLGRELWATDGTADGTELVAEVEPGPQSSQLGALRGLVRVGPRIFFVGTDSAHGNELWVTDGTTAGTQRLTNLSGFAQTSLGPVAGRVVFFSTFQGLWSSDGTPGGTTAIRSDLSSALGSPFVETDGHLFFIGFNTTRHRYGLWTSDGRPGGTREILDLGSAERPHPFFIDLAVAGERIYYLFPGEDQTVGLWVTDGAGANPHRLASFPFHTPPESFVVLGGRLLFSVADPTLGREPWVSDGTVAGTIPLGDLVPGVRGAFDSSANQGFAVLGSRAYFAVSGACSSALWQTEGTPDTTRPADGPAFAGLGGVPVAHGDALFFAADDGVHGMEPWTTDGTPGGTRRLADVEPGPGGSFPAAFLPDGDRLLFRASTRLRGAELYSLSLAEPAGLAAPGNLTATPVSPSEVRLDWQDLSAGEEAFAIEQSTVDTGYRRIAVVPANSESFVVGGLIPGQPSTFRVRAEGLGSPSAWSREASVVLGEVAQVACAPTPESLCLGQGRFTAEVSWRDSRSGDTGRGTAVPLTGSDRSGLFWFFDPANVELIVKVLDGGGVNGYHWVFFGALTDVEYWVVVTDQIAATRRVYHSPAGEICGQGDTAAFPAGELRGGPLPAVGVDLGPPEPRSGAPVSADAGCVPSATDLCLQAERFRVQVSWRDPRSGNQGIGQALPATDKTGFFWFFDAANIELVVKILDGRPVNGNYWVFYGALSDVDYTVTVTDTVTQQTRTYRNPPGQICGRADTTAFEVGTGGS